MKQKDLVLIAVVVFFASIVSLLVSKFFISSETNRNLSAEIVQPITPEFQPPDKSVFNGKAINPTKLIQIGENDNKTPIQ